jgi:cbb3-type cytochrome oxidase maturation protein
MEILYLLVPVSVALVFLTGWAFWRALHSGQFDDLERPAHDILDEDEQPFDPGQAPSPQRAHAGSGSSKGVMP